MTTEEFISQIDNVTAKVLTVESAKELKGHQIAWMYFGYSGNENVVSEMVIGDIISELEYNETQPCKGFNSRAEYWRSYMDKQALEDAENTLLLLDINGKCPYIKAHIGRFNIFEEPTFTCSDADRQVFYIEIK